MSYELIPCPWVAIVLFLLLSESPTLLMAFCAHNTHRVRSLASSPHLRNSQVYLGKRSVGLNPRTYSINLSKDQGNDIHRHRSFKLHADAQGQASIPTSKLPPASLLLTVMDRHLPFGRCVGVALPASLTAETLRLAGQELMPEEVSYCLKLPRLLQVMFESRVQPVFFYKSTSTQKLSIFSVELSVARIKCASEARAIFYNNKRYNKLFE